MAIQKVPFDSIISSMNDWVETKGNMEVLLTATSSPKLGVAYFQYSYQGNNSPVLAFRPNSKIRIIGEELIYDSDDVDKSSS